MPKVTMDFETRSLLDLTEVGAFKYSKDPSTSVLILGYKIDGINRQWIPGEPLPLDLFKAIKEAKEVRAHNAEFEYCIWNYTCKKYKFSTLPIHFFICEAATAAALALPRKLEQLGPAIGASVLKDSEGKRVMLKLSKPRKPTKTNSALFHEDPDDFKIMAQYNLTDLDSEEACSERMPPLPPEERRLWEFTVKINERGIYCDVEKIKTALAFCNQYETELIEELKELTNFEVSTAKQVAKIRAFLESEGVEIPDLTAATVRAYLEKDLPIKAKRLLQIRQALGLSSVSKLQKMLDMVGEDNRIRGTLLYHGASTGRFSGRGIQPQNFPRGSIKDVDNIFEAMDLGYEFFNSIFPDLYPAISSALRGMLTAAPGKRLMAGDWSAIEAKVVMWISDCKAGLEAFASGADIYVDMAVDIYKTHDIGKDKRQLGKQAILGCGFSMGPDKFLITCQGYGMDISLELAKLAVKTYREKFWEVKEFWKGIETAAIEAVDTRKLIIFKRLQLLVKDGFLFIKLPSGRKLAYFAPKITTVEREWGPVRQLSYMAVNGTTRQWQRESTYGGKLTENIVQAIARDVMVAAMFRVEENNYPVILSVHDEIISEVDNNFGTLEKFEDLLSELPDWAQGLPTSVECWEGLRYKK